MSSTLEAGSKATCELKQKQVYIPDSLVSHPLPSDEEHSLMHKVHLTMSLQGDERVEDRPNNTKVTINAIPLLPTLKHFVF